MTADSYYEYLIKQHQLISGATDQFKDMYEEAMDMAEIKLFMDVDVIPGRDYMVSFTLYTSFCLFELDAEMVVERGGTRGRLSARWIII